MITKEKLVKNSLLITVISAVIIAISTIMITLLLLLSYLQQVDAVDFCHLQIKELEKALVKKELD